MEASSATNSRDRLKAIAKETQEKLPDILKERPDLNATTSEYLSFNDFLSMDPGECPNFDTEIRVVNQDSFDAALELAKSPPKSIGRSGAMVTLTPQPLVMNFASDKNPGGGWLNGSMAQEEALCYRSSLSMALDKSHYPMALHKFSYTKDVLIIRDSEHELLVPQVTAKDLPVVSCLNIAALRRPKLNGDKYDRDSDREWMRKKMRYTLRVAAEKGHSRLVLGAFGCGAFMNPVEEVAKLWREVLLENEFKGGWWEYIVFAVLWKAGPNQTGKKNFEIFKDHLDGLTIDD